jgi:hypothetical protein
MSCNVCCSKKVKRCSDCKIISYCSAKCQKKDREVHGLLCSMKKGDKYEKILIVAAERYLFMNYEIIFDHFNPILGEYETAYKISAAWYKLCSIYSDPKKRETILHRRALAWIARTSKIGMFNSGNPYFIKEPDEEFYNISAKINVFNDMPCIKYRDYMKNMYKSVEMYINLGKDLSIPKDTYVGILEYLNEIEYYRTRWLNYICRIEKDEMFETMMKNEKYAEYMRFMAENFHPFKIQTDRSNMLIVNK